jgi:hypothetical protein
MCCSTDARVHKLEWFQGTGPKQIPDHAQIASVLSRLLRRHPPPADPHQALPTPTAAVWESMHTSVDILLMTERFFTEVEYTPHITSLGGVDFISESLLSLQRDMAAMPYNLVGGHLPNLSLDVTQLMR